MFSEGVLSSLVSSGSESMVLAAMARRISGNPVPTVWDSVAAAARYGKRCTKNGGARKGPTSKLNYAVRDRART